MRWMLLCLPIMNGLHAFKPEYLTNWSITSRWDHLIRSISLPGMSIMKLAIGKLQRLHVTLTNMILIQIQVYPQHMIEPSLNFSAVNDHFRRCCLPSYFSFDHSTSKNTQLKCTSASLTRIQFSTWMLFLLVPDSIKTAIPSLTRKERNTLHFLPEMPLL